MLNVILTPNIRSRQSKCCWHNLSSGSCPLGHLMMKHKQKFMTDRLVTSVSCVFRHCDLGASTRPKQACNDCSSQHATGVTTCDCHETTFWCARPRAQHQKFVFWDSFFRQNTATCQWLLCRWPNRILRTLLGGVGPRGKGAGTHCSARHGRWSFWMRPNPGLRFNRKPFQTSCKGINV